MLLVEGDEFGTMIEFYVNNLDVALQVCIADDYEILRWNERDHWLKHPKVFTFHLEQRK